MSGIIGSKKTHLPAIASKAPDGRKRESRAKRFARFLQNKNVTPEAFFVPYAQALVERAGVSRTPVGRAAGPGDGRLLVMDGSQVGRGGMALMVSVLFQQGQPGGRTLKCALPLCWQVVKAGKGHFPKVTFPRSSIKGYWHRLKR